MEKVVFVNTPLQDYSVFKRSFYETMAPLGLGSLATIVRQLGYDVELLDGEYKCLSPEEIITYIRKNDFNTVGINVQSSSLPIAKKIIEDLKGLKIIVGGSHATFCPEHILKNIKGIDILVKGEGEETIKEIFEERPLETINGISYLFNGEIVNNPDRDLIHDLDQLPFIDRSFFNEGNEANIITTRGCPFNCIYCGSKVCGKQLRERSIESVVDEMELLYSRHRKFHFVDDNFILRKERLLGYITELEKRGLNIEWRSLVRVDTFSSFEEGLVKKIKESGCKMLSFGMESGNPRVLKLIKKGTTPEQAKKAVQLCYEAGIQSKAFFMLGFPTETVDEMKDTINFAYELKELGLNSAHFCLVRVYPGTEMFHMLGDDENLLRYKVLKKVIKVNEAEKEFLRKKGVDCESFLKYAILNKKSISTVNIKTLINLMEYAYKKFYFGDYNGSD